MITILPIHVDERIKVFSSLPFMISDELINIFANNKYIYAISDTPTVRLEYISFNSYEITRVCPAEILPGTRVSITNNINSNKPFILYKVEDYFPLNYPRKIIRGVNTPNFENEVLYRQYMENFVIYRENRINTILE